MPLSEDEQRILDEIERGLKESDPRLAKEVGETTIYRHALGSLKWAMAGVLLGAVAMISTLTIHWALAFAGFVLMLVSAMGLEKNLRVMGKASFSQVSSAFKTGRTASEAEAVDED